MIKRKKSESGREVPISFVSRGGTDAQAAKEVQAGKPGAEDRPTASEAERARLLDEQDAGPATVTERAAAEAVDDNGAVEVEAEEVEPGVRERGLAQEYLEHLQRLQAEFANYRKRTLKELRESCDSGKAELVCKLLPVVDDFERALDSLKPDAANQEALKGVRMIYDKLRSTLEAEGLEHFQCAGQQFDPNVHEAVVVTRVDEGPDGRVIRDFQKGYSFKGKLIRPSKVEVAQVEDDDAGRE